MAEEKESTSIPLSQADNASCDDPEDPAKSPPNSPNSSTRRACCFVLQSWVSKKFMTGCVVLFPVAVTFFITWWFIQFVDGFFSPIYSRLGIDIFGLGFITSLIFVFLIGVFVSSWMGATVFWLGEWFIKRMPLVRHIYSASKQISAAISPDQNTTAFKEVAIIRHPRIGEYAFGFITSTVTLQLIWPRGEDERRGEKQARVRGWGRFTSGGGSQSYSGEGEVEDNKRTLRGARSVGVSRGNNDWVKLDTGPAIKLIVMLAINGLT